MSAIIGVWIVVIILALFVIVKVMAMAGRDIARYYRDKSRR